MPIARCRAALPSPFDCDAPARGGAVADDRRVVAGGEGGAQNTGRERRVIGSVTRFGVRASVGRVAADRSASRHPIRFASLEREPTGHFTRAR
jgi:hypothetical protein